MTDHYSSRLQPVIDPDDRPLLFGFLFIVVSPSPAGRGAAEGGAAGGGVQQNGGGPLDPPTGKLHLEADDITLQVPFCLCVWLPVSLSL